MTPIQAFTEAGCNAFHAWIEAGAPGGSPSGILADAAPTTPCGDEALDEGRQFASRYEFGVYLQSVLKNASLEQLLAPASDGMWAWVNALYFKQLAPKDIRRFEHYIPVRRGTAGSLLHRNAARTSFELVS